MYIRDLIQSMRKYSERTMTTAEYQTIIATAANELERLNKMIDDENGDAFLDYYDFYVKKSFKLFQQKERLIEILKKEAQDLCKYCKHKDLYCNGVPCEQFINTTNYNGKTKTCMDENFGECPKLKDSPCAKCIHNNDGFEWSEEE